MSYTNNPAADWDAHIRNEEYFESLLIGACEGSKKGFFREPCPHNGNCILQDTDNTEKMIDHCARLRHITRCLNQTSNNKK
ncbi:hypothetical protein [Bacteroides sp.]|uniref:hypothetical protein n=1 Tax=Bacteroides sp. TaxID=29523 RepID=UPI0026096172|nr:hypothetical protein [Bacteroides sp.]MDD3039095.1 hypothetical protein [Bacteroides sp.]